VLNWLLTVEGFNPGSEHNQQSYKVATRWNLKDLMELCWNDAPKEQPNFKQIKKYLDEDSGVDLF
jgi:hypothetical protein